MMSAANTAYLLIVAITIAMINISSASTWAASPDSKCKSPGVPCHSVGNHNNCSGDCVCKYYNDASTGWGFICLEPGSPEANVTPY
uniref:Defensin n=1 Tax=Rhipicephalus zambeziensis TaxID=60191 RepID=A0A224YDF7_9ACAR